jgi:hypothetical protein
MIRIRWWIMVELINDMWMKYWLIKCKWQIIYYANWLNEEMMFIDVIMITWWCWYYKHDDEILMWIVWYIITLVMMNCWCKDVSIWQCNDVFCVVIYYIMVWIIQWWVYGDVHCRVYTWSTCIHSPVITKLRITVQRD